MSPTNRRRVLWGAALLGLANVATYLAYTLPRSLQKKNVASRVEQLTVELSEDRARVAALKARTQTIVSNRKDAREFMDSRIGAPGTSLVPILSEVESLAKGQGLTVGTQGFNRESVEGLPLDRFEINMPVTGTYDQVTGLLVQLEGSAHFLTLDQISARQQQGGTGEGSVALNLLFSAYFRGSAEAVKP